MAASVPLLLSLREAARVSVQSPYLRPTGLADGLALKGLRYRAAVPGFAPGDLPKGHLGSPVPPPVGRAADSAWSDGAAV
jgi:hypothetical protein